MFRKRIALKHAIFWLIFVGYEITFLHFTVGFQGSFFTALIFYLFNIFLFYFNAHVILDFAFSKTDRPYIIAIALTAIEILTYVLIKYIFDLVIFSFQKGRLILFHLNEMYLFTNFWRGIYFIGLSIAYWSLLSMIRLKDRNHVIETEQLKGIAKTLELENKYISVENAFLQNQISPHLLFNSLSFIYTSVRRLSDKAGNGVMLLSDLMRYSLVTGGDAKSVFLAKEVEQVENLINLSRLRQEDQFYLRFSRKGKLSGIRIIPLLLVTLVENVIKHGELGDPKNPAKVTLIVEDKRLSFHTANLIRTSSPYAKGGLGLKNLQKRLNNAYPDNSEFHFNAIDGVFVVSLIITL